MGAVLLAKRGDIAAQRGERLAVVFDEDCRAGAARQGFEADGAGAGEGVEHRTLGAFDLFVNPVGRGVKGLNLEAVINRIAT